MTSTPIAVSSNRPLRVGFDLDGVILYNPIRIVRPLITKFKRLILGKQEVRFYVPTSSVEKKLFRLFHKSSLFIAPGFTDLPALVDSHRMVAHLVTARFAFLKPDLDAWLKKIDRQHLFTSVHQNLGNDQPHLFKAQIIKKLNLDIFVEDNWDIVKYLTEQRLAGTFNTRIFWLSNIFDRRIPYPDKFTSFSQIVTRLRHLS